MYSWGNSLILIILGAVMVVVSGGYLILRMVRRKATYENLKPQENPNKDGPSATVVFIFLASLAAFIGLLVLGLGIFGLIAPQQLEEPIAVAMHHGLARG